MNCEFKEQEIGEAERLWLAEVYENDGFDIKKAKVKLWKHLPKDFDPEAVDSRLYRNGRLTLLGIWHIDPENPIFDHAGKVITAIRDRILEEPGIETFTTADIAQYVQLEEKEIGHILYLVSDMGRFFSSASGESDTQQYNSISLSGDDAYDAYLSFRSIEELMDEFFKSRRPGQPLHWPMELQQQDEAIHVRKNTAFIIMPIDPDKPELEDVCDVIKKVCSQFGIEARRADEIQHQQSITDIVLKEIRECEFLIADLSYERPNVYYEIGYAHALGKHPILYRRRGTKLHFDLSVHNVPEYRNMTDLSAKLFDRFEAVLGRTPEGVKS